MAARSVAIVALIGLALGGTRVSGHDEYRFAGTVVKLEAGKGPVSYFVLTLETKQEGHLLALKILLTERTPIEREGSKVSLKALEPGVSIVIDATGESYDDLEALRIKIVPPPAPPK